MCYILIVCATYFMVTEIEYFVKGPFNYLNLTNMVDLVPMILIYLQTFESLTNHGMLDYGFWIKQSVCAVLMWVKFILFLKS